MYTYTSRAPAPGAGTRLPVVRPCPTLPRPARAAAACGVLLAVAPPAFADRDVHASVTALTSARQTVAPNQPLPEALAVLVTDGSRTPLAGVTVWFDVDYCVPSPALPSCPPLGLYGDFAGKAGVSVVTDHAGRAFAPAFTAGDGEGSYRLHATVPAQQWQGKFVDQRGAPATFAVDQVAAGALAQQPAGFYADPARDGEGWQLTFGSVAGKPTVVAVWYTYDQGRPVWLLGASTYAGVNGVTTLALTQTSGAKFGPDFKPADVLKAPWGRADLRWSGCSTLDVAYLRADGVQGTLHLTRVFASTLVADCR